MLSPYGVAGVHAMLGFAYWPQAGSGFALYIVWLAFCVGYASCLFAKAHRAATDTQRFQYRILMVAYLIGYIGGATNFPIWYGVPFPPYGTIFVSIYAIAVASILVHARLLDVSLAVERSLPYVFMAIVVTPAIAVFLYAQVLYFGSMHMEFSLLVALVFGLFVIAGTWMLVNMRAALSSLLFRERHAMYEAMTHFSKSLVTNLDLQSLSRDLVRTVGQLMGIQHVTLYLLQQDQHVFAPVARYGNIPSPPAPRIPVDAPLPRHLAQTRDLLVPTELGQPCSSVQEDIQQSCEFLGAEVGLPLVSKNMLFGFCILGPRSSKERYAEADLDLLRMVSQEAAIALDNARLYEELKRSQALVRRTDRLRSLEIMAGGLAHEIRNPLTSIKAFVDLAPERRDDEDFLMRFSRIVKEDVARIERLTREILDYARPTDPHLQYESLNEIVESCVYSVRTRPTYRTTTFQLELAGDLPAILADRQQVKQVLLNLLLNGLEAMGPQGGTLTLRTYALKKAHRDDACVEVNDTGPGIAPDDLEHIFDPFFTTKHLSSEHEGTGLGLAIAHQIVQEHRGCIEVSSQLGHGTTFIIRFPVPHADSVHQGASSRGEQSLSPGTIESMSQPSIGNSLPFQA